MQQGNFKVRVDGTDYAMDLNRMTFAEARALERTVGKPMADMLGRDSVPDMTTVQGFVWVTMKRSEPTLKFTDLDDREISEFEFLDDDDEEDVEPDPTEAATAAWTSSEPTISEPSLRS